MPDFDEWLRSVFDRKVAAAGETPWYFAIPDDAAMPENDPPATLAHLARLFARPEILVGQYTANQIGQGLWYLANPSCSDHLFALRDQTIDWPLRKQAIEAIGTLNERLFTVVCDKHLSHLDRAAEPANRTNLVCYMFWDVSPLKPEGDAGNDYDLTCLGVMRRSLGIDHVACQEGALHGLGIWQGTYPDAVREAIDAYLRAQPRPKELADYAERASRGDII
jgi:hypothetical protein